MQKIEIDTVNKIAAMCKVDVSGSEERLAELLTDTLTYMEILEELDLERTSPTYQVTGLENVYQTRRNKATLGRMEALSNAGGRSHDLFYTKAVFIR